MIPRFPVYLFDIDGTLLDSAADICGAVGHALDTVPNRPSTSQPYLRSFIGRHLIDLFQDVFPAAPQEEIDRLIAEYRRVYLARGHKQTRVYPGVAEGLAALTRSAQNGDCKGPALSTATTKGTPTTRAVLDQFGLLPHFSHVQGTDGFPCKPAPDVILAAIAGLGANTKDVLMVGDSPPDIEAGRRAGVKTCAVRYGYGDPDKLAQHQPDYWIDDLRELA